MDKFRIVVVVLLFIITVILLLNHLEMKHSNNLQEKIIEYLYNHKSN